MASFANKISIAAALFTAAHFVQASSANEGQCVTKPAPGYNFTVTQICYGPEYSGVNSDGQLALGMFAEGDDPLAAGDGTADSYVNYVPYAYFADDNNNYISQFYPPGYDLTTCKPFACHDGQPCAFWGAGGSPEVNTYVYWTNNHVESYGGCRALDAVYRDDGMVLNLRDTGNTWFTCKPAAQELCTAGNATINYLFDCARVSAAIMATEKTPLSAPVGDGGINEHGSHHCHNAGGALSALRGVIESLNNDTMVLTGEQIACYQNNICIWYQGDAVGTLKQTKDLLQTLASYGVQDCGSIPVRYAEGSNEVSYGMLTADTNSDPCCYAYSLQETCVCPHFQ